MLEGVKFRDLGKLAGKIENPKKKIDPETAISPTHRAEVLHARGCGADVTSLKISF